jgi:hypothetical protein
MKVTEKYLEALKQCEGWVTAGEWALKVAELYPAVLEKANKQAENQKNDTTGMRELTARIHSNVSRGAYEGMIEIDMEERPRRFRYALPDEIEKRIDEELDEEMASLTRAERIRKDYESLSTYERYRIQELEAIAKAFNGYFKTDLEVDHAQSLMGDNPGRHHPDNLQLISKTHNRIKSKKNWERMSLEKQLEYLEKMMVYHEVVFDVDKVVLNSLMERIRTVY